MKKLLGLLVFVGINLNAQIITIVGPDSLPVNNVLIANMIMDETVFTNENGQADLTIFQDHDELLQIIHQSFQTIILPKDALLAKEQIQLERSSNKIGVVEIPIASKTKESSYELITQTKTISKENIQQMAPANTADMLANTGQVQIQKSQLGGGSPILRGFEANRILLVVDGVRMNNAIYRSGHLQNAISIDPNMLEGTEVIFGPNSLIYGSDALGGVIHFKTRDPKVKKDSADVERIDGTLRYQSAMDAFSANATYQNGTEKFAYLISLTQNTFNDLRMGANRFHGFDDFGRINNYVFTQNNQDTMLVNQDPNVVRGSGYQQSDILWKGIYQPNENRKYKLNVQFSTTSNVPRVDKLNEYRDETLRYAQWDYGPQNRSLFSFASESKSSNKWFDYNNTVAAYQLIEEDRISREFQSDLQENTNEDVQVYSFNSDFIKHLDTLKRKKINYGFEVLHNKVNSNAFVQNILTNEKSFLETRYPGGGSQVTSGAAYLALQRRLKNHTFKGGLRYTYSHILAEFDTNNITNLLDIGEVSLSNQAVTSSAGYVFTKGNYKLYSSITSAFKSPNIDDVGKVFQKREDLSIPNTNLKPETSVNYELGSNYLGRYLDFDVAVYYTQIFDLMTKLNTNIAGVDSINLNGEDLNLVSLQNSGKANIYGAFLALRLKLTNRLNWYTTATYTKGFYPNNDEVVAHIPPAFGRSSLDYKLKKLKLSLYANFNARKKWNEFNALTDNPEEAIQDFGSPAWATLNVSAFVYATEKVKLQFAAENLLDAHYKTFASGISAPGRNLIASLYFKF